MLSNIACHPENFLPRRPQVNHASCRNVNAYDRFIPRSGGLHPLYVTNNPEDVKMPIFPPLHLLMQRRKLISVLVLAALLITGFMATSLTSYFVARDSLANNISEQMLPLTSDNIYSEIQRDLLRPVLISSVMSADSFFHDWVADGETNPARMQAYLKGIQQEYNTITAFFVSDHTYQYYHPDGIIKTVSETAPEDDWYFRSRAMRTPFEINVDSDTADRSRVSIFINYRVVDASGQLLGVTGVGLSVTAVVDLINTYQQRYGR